MTASARPGNTVTVDGQHYQLWSLAQPSGWWAVPIGGSSKRPVRIRTERNSRTGLMEWQVAPA